MEDNLFERVSAEEMLEHKREEEEKMNQAIQEQLAEEKNDLVLDEKLEEFEEPKTEETEAMPDALDEANEISDWEEQIDPQEAIEDIAPKQREISALDIVRMAKLTEGLSDEKFDEVFSKSDGSVESIKRLVSDPNICKSELRRAEILKGLNKNKY